MHVKITDRTFM